MKILLFEYVTGGGLAEEALPPSLLREGERMVNALLGDLIGERVYVLRDWRLPSPRAIAEEHCLTYVGFDAPFQKCWHVALAWAEAVWVIAPETVGILERFASAVVEAGKILLGARPRAVSATADKYCTVLQLQARDIACIPAWPLEQFAAQVPPPWIIKPRDGVGCDGVVKLERLPEDGADLLVQPFVAGEPFSISAVFASGNAVCISVNRQQLEKRGEGFHLCGCHVNVDEPGHHWQKLCSQIASAFPDLWGYAGIDVILTEKGPLVVEINPRLTLSYVGLSQALGASLARQIVALAEGRLSLPDIATWRRTLGRGKTVWVEA